jgi:hypothetical protein
MHQGRMHAESLSLSMARPRQVVHRGDIVIRYLPLLALLACARNSVPPQETPPPAESSERAPAVEPDAEACDWNRPGFDEKGTIEESSGALIVEDLGREPRAVRRYRRPSVDKVRYVVQKTGRARRTLGTAPPEAWVVYPSVELDVEWRLVAADEDGRRQVAFHVVNAAQGGPAVVPGEVEDPLAKSLPAPELDLVGLTVGYATEPSGASAPLTNDVARFPEPAYLLATFADQPIGAGATWGKTDVLSGGISVISRHRFQLLDVAGSRLRVGLEFSQEHNAHRQFLDDGTPQEFTVVMTVRGEVVVDLAGAPIEGAWKLTVRGDLAQCKAEKIERSSVDVETAWTWKRR